MTVIKSAQELGVFLEKQVSEQRPQWAKIVSFYRKALNPDLKAKDRVKYLHMLLKNLDSRGIEVDMSVVRELLN